MESNSLLRYAQRLQAIAQAGISYAVTPYDRERYEEIQEISAKLLEELSGEPYEKIVRLFASETAYPTPKVDVRAVLFRGEDQILLVKEKNDHQRWALPGGWADIGYTPFEVAVKEVQEETGLSVRAVRLLALYDKRMHPHPPQAWYVYKVFIQCAIDGGQMLQDTVETAGASWFRSEELSTLELSTDRVTESQLRTLFRFAKDPELPALCD